MVQSSVSVRLTPTAQRQMEELVNLGLSQTDIVISGIEEIHRKYISPQGTHNGGKPSRINVISIALVRPIPPNWLEPESTVSVWVNLRHGKQQVGLQGDEARSLIERLTRRKNFIHVDEYLFNIEAVQAFYVVNPGTDDAFVNVMMEQGTVRLLFPSANVLSAAIERELETFPYLAPPQWG